MKGTTAKDAEQKTEGRHIRSTAEGDGGHICVDAASSETSSHEVTCQTTDEGLLGTGTGTGTGRGQRKKQQLGNKMFRGGNELMKPITAPGGTFRNF